MDLRRTALLAVSVGLLAQPAGAATYYWDSDGTVIGFGTAGGTWGSSAYWNTDSTGGAGGSFGIPATTSDQVNFGTASDGLAAGTVTVTGSTQGFANMTFGAASGAITLSSGTLNLGANAGIAVHNASNTVSTLLQGAGSLTKSGTGTLYLANISNSYSGGTTISAGKISTYNTNSGYGYNSGNFGTGTVTINSGTWSIEAQYLSRDTYWANSFALNGATVQSSIKTVRLGMSNTGVRSTIDISGAGASLTAGFNNLYLDGQLTGNGPLTLPTPSGNSTVQVTNDANTYSGTVTVGGAQNKAVILSLGAANALKYASVDMQGGTAYSALQLNTAGTTYAIAGLTGTGAVQPNATAGMYTLALSNAVDNSFAGVLRNNTGTLAVVKSGAGRLTLSNANSYSGGTTINGGILQLTGGDNRLPTTGDVTLTDTAGAVLDLNNVRQTIGALSGGGANGGNITLGSGTLTVNQGLDTTFGGVISGGGGGKQIRHGHAHALRQQLQHRRDNRVGRRPAVQQSVCPLRRPRIRHLG